MRRNGFTTIIALTLLALITAALSAIAIGLHAEAQRTHSMQIRAELRQLLLAGGSNVNQLSQSWPALLQPGDWSMELPTALSAGKISGHVIPVGTAEADVRLTVQLQTHLQVQIIHLLKDQAGWHIQNAQMSSAGNPE